MWSYGTIEPSWTIEIASEDNTYENLWILWRHVKFKKCKSGNINHILWLKCLIFLCFWVELWKTFENNGQGIKISIRMKKCHFWVKNAVFIKNENEILKNSDFCYTWSNDHIQSVLQKSERSDQYSRKYDSLKYHPIGITLFCIETLENNARSCFISSQALQTLPRR